MTASEAPLAGVRVDSRVMRVAALFVQPDGCYAWLPGTYCMSRQKSIQSVYATQRPKSREGIPGRLSSSKPRKSAVANCAMAEGQSRESREAFWEMGEGKSGESSREKACLEGKEHGEAPTNSTRMAGTCWVQPTQKRTGRPCSPATQNIWINRTIVCRAIERARWLLCDLRAIRTRNEKLVQAICRSLPRNRISTWATLSCVQHYAGKRKRHGERIARRGRIS